MKVFPDDCLRVGLCVRGQKRFFRAHGLDFDKFYLSGIEESDLVGIEDAYKDRALQQARLREAGK